MKCLYAEIPTSTCVYVWPISMYFFDCCTAFHPSSKWTKCHGWPTVVLITLPDYPWLAVSYHVHIPVENEHLFRFKMNADSGLRVHRFRTPQCTYSDVRWTVLFQPTFRTWFRNKFADSAHPIPPKWSAGLLLGKVRISGEILLGWLSHFISSCLSRFFLP